MAKTKTTYNVYFSVVEGSKDNVVVYSGCNKAEASKAFNKAYKQLYSLIASHKDEDNNEWSLVRCEDNPYGITIDYSNCWRLLYEKVIEYLDKDGEVDEFLTEFEAVDNSEMFFTHNIYNF